jgi:hypothetical protein
MIRIETVYEGVYHNALDDAKAQARTAVLMLNEIGRGRAEKRSQ